MPATRAALLCPMSRPPYLQAVAHGVAEPHRRFDAALPKRHDTVRSGPDFHKKGDLAGSSLLQLVVIELKPPVTPSFKVVPANSIQLPTLLMTRCYLVVLCTELVSNHSTGPLKDT